VIEWMVQKGARYLLVPSRSGASSQSARDLVETMSKQGVHMETPCCDVSSAEDFSQVLRDYTTRVPHAPIKGGINSAMVLNDSIFANMTHGQWTRTLNAKVQSSLNLHNMLPKDVDFFVLFSSLVGVYGAAGQSNYAAGGAFQDSLARARSEDRDTYPGTSLSLDLGWFIDAGVVAENKELQKRWKRETSISGVKISELIAMLDYYCDPARPAQTPGPTGRLREEYASSQLLVGPIAPADLDLPEDQLPVSVARPLHAALRSITSKDAANEDGDPSSSQTETLSASARFKAASTHEERSEAVVYALRERLARALDVQVDDVEANKKAAEYGVDSLMAVELRTWMRKDYGVEVPVFEILGPTILKIGEIVTNKVEENERAKA
jgi:acyl carrier protein